MKSEFVTLSLSALFCLFCAGVFLAAAVFFQNALYALSAFALLFYVREDAREACRAGQYKRGWMFWTRTGPCE